MLARKSFLIVTTHFISDFLGWIGIVVLAKLWGSFAPEALGIIGFAMSFVSLFGIITDLGFSTAHVKRVSEGQDFGKCIGTFATIKLALTGVMVLLIFISMYILNNFDKGFTDATTESVVIVVIFQAIFSNLQSIATETFIGRREIAKLQITRMMENLVKVPLSIIVALAGVTITGYANITPAINWPDFLKPFQNYISTHAVGSLAMTYVIGMAATFFIGIWFMRKYPLKKPSLDIVKSYLFFAIPIMFTDVVGTIAASLDKVMIGYFWTSTEVGYYFTVQRILGFVAILSGAVGTILFPLISEHHSNKDYKKIIKTTYLAERYISMVLIPPIILIIVFINPVIEIMLSDAFLPAGSVLIALLIFTYIRGITTPYGNLIGGINKPRKLAEVGITITSINIVLNLLFIPKEGMLSSFGINGATGAAVATIFAHIVGFFRLRYYAKKYTKIKLFQTHTPRHLIAGLGMALILYVIGTIFPVIRWYHLIIFAGFGLLVYLAILRLLKEFNKDDLKFFISIINPKGMFGYIKSEVKEK